jgi:glycosidase
MTLPGVPSVYYGDEQGYQGLKEERFGGDDAIRPAFPMSPSERSPLGENHRQAYQQLIALRRANPWLADATTATLHLENTHYVYRVTAREGHTWADVELRAPGDTGQAFATIRDQHQQTLWTLTN